MRPSSAEGEAKGEGDLRHEGRLPALLISN
jgi:hypothetical protein